MIVKTSIQKYCPECKIIKRNEWCRNYLKDEENMIKHKLICKKYREKIKNAI
jgi:ribosomal protein L36